jgi:hypothetical protein
MNTKISKLQKWIRVACVVVPLVFAVTVIFNGFSMGAPVKVARTPKGQAMADLRTLLAMVDYAFHAGDGTQPVTPSPGGVAFCTPVSLLGSNQPAIFCADTNQPVRS